MHNCTGPYAGAPIDDVSPVGHIDLNLYCLYSYILAMLGQKP